MRYFFFLNIWAILFLSKLHVIISGPLLKYKYLGRVIKEQPWFSSEIIIQVITPVNPDIFIVPTDIVELSLS